MYAQTEVQITPAGMPEGVRARVWVAAHQLFARSGAQGYCWLWLIDARGCVRALRVDAAGHGRDDRLAACAAHFAATPGEAYADPVLGTVRPLLGAPAVPVPRWQVSWGHPLQLTIREFAEQLDGEVLAGLGRLEMAGLFFGTAGNYNRLAVLPQPARAHRIQALDLFPPLVAPILLDTFGRPDMFGGDEDEPRQRARLAPAARSPVLEAMDRGRDLVGALAKFYVIDRALVRAPMLRRPWREPLSVGLLRLLHAIPAHARPRSLKALEDGEALLANSPLHCHTGDDARRIAHVFAGGWDATWRRLKTQFAPLDNQLHDCHDFLRRALEQVDLPADLDQENFDVPELAQAWVARHGLRSLLVASRRWHALPTVERHVDDGLPAQIEPLFDRWQNDQDIAIELTTPEALLAEGEHMHHCVGSYWHQCTAGGDRIVHLQLADGEQATAHYFGRHHDEQARYERIALRGPCNADPSDNMRALAARITRVLNDPALQRERLRVRSAAEAASATRWSAGPRIVRELDAGLRRALAQAVAFARTQKDWCLQPGALFEGAVAGFAYGDGAGVLEKIAVGDALQLLREPDNANDPNAVRVLWQDHKLGYVPRRVSAMLARLLDAGQPLTARVACLREDIPWAPVHCLIQRVAAVEPVSAAGP